MSRPLGLESMLVSGIPYLPIPAVHLQLSYGKSPFFWSNSMGWDPKPETRLKKWMCLMYPEIGYHLVINILLLKMEHRNSWFIFYRLWIFQLAIFVFTRKSTSIFLWFSYGVPMVFLWFSCGFMHFPMEDPTRPGHKTATAHVPSRCPGISRNCTEKNSFRVLDNGEYVWVYHIYHVYIYIYVSYIYDVYI